MLADKLSDADSLIDWFGLSEAELLKDAEIEALMDSDSDRLIDSLFDSLGVVEAD